MFPDLTHDRFADLSSNCRAAVRLPAESSASHGSYVSSFSVEPTHRTRYCSGRDLEMRRFDNMSATSDIDFPARAGIGKCVVFLLV
jgi:hypothetical protein